MKLALGAALLLALFALVVSLERRKSQAAKPEPAGAPAASFEDEPGWGSVVVGAPSGAAPLGDEDAGSGAAPQAPAPGPGKAPSGPASAPGAPAPAKPLPPTAHAFELSVAKGQTLSTICKEHYGSARVELVQALARANGLASPDAVREGQKLTLPPLEELTAKKP